MISSFPLRYLSSSKFSSLSYLKRVCFVAVTPYCPNQEQWQSYIQIKAGELVRFIIPSFNPSEYKEIIGLNPTPPRGVASQAEPNVPVPSALISSYFCNSSFYNSIFIIFFFFFLDLLLERVFGLESLGRVTIRERNIFPIY